MYKSKLKTQKLKTEKTPFYYYDLDLLKTSLSAAKSEADKYGYVLHYASKANANPVLMKIISAAGFGADCVSGNEIIRAVECGFPPELINFAGVGKSDEEINIGLDNRIFCFNCESMQEIEVIDELAARRQCTAPLALRVNPNVDAHSHHYITTGLEENKFGIAINDLNAVVDRLLTLKNVKLIGLHFHVGSQISDMNVFRALCQKMNECNETMRARNLNLVHLNAGGGLGVDYENPDENPIPDFASYFGVFNEFLKLYPGQKLHFEPGRSIVAQCGALVSKVLYVKKGQKINFAILDAGMTDLIRPALYQAYHKIENLSSDLPEEIYDVVGPICESSDCFGKAVRMAEARRGDFVVIRTAGAYGEMMASRYNLRKLPESTFSN
ncbi:MAG: diaminopimelate decarboxylase [Prevotellaceae bacterium]|jgi:diaminopimelate decarboxylase|nr:diaminopimelate decarboxylase [Prevotellaceae bacterium]